ncbi:hypothetical protein DPMN_184034 [Dreissena polymorpha]|uniref:EGF-like domain-containing protein n=2 Tax=Dreissena polymorpha TaxID=45954 RepID=A0A9D4DIQ9_DREPO|nr:hypothetical protein DPMN_184034 [Dreissena polymorpha]
MMNMIIFVLVIGSCGSSFGFIYPNNACWEDGQCQHGGTCQTAPNHFLLKNCKCKPEYTGHYCEQRITPAPQIHTTQITTQAPTTRPVATTTLEATTTPVPTTTPMPTTTTIATTTELHLYTDTPHCAKYSIVFDIADTIISHNALASVCSSSGNHSSPEAFVLNHCDLAIKNPKEWQKGHQVMTNCTAVPAYTPVIETSGDEFSSGTHRSGIFLECLPEPEGFKMVYQGCDSIPIIEHVTSDKAKLFYTVQ